MDTRSKQLPVATPSAFFFKRNFNDGFETTNDHIVLDKKTFMELGLEYESKADSTEKPLKSFRPQADEVVRLEFDMLIFYSSLHCLGRYIVESSSFTKEKCFITC